MLVNQPDIFIMRQDVQDFTAEVFNSTLPPHTENADIRLLWVAADRMVWFKQMAEASKTEREFNFMMAIYHDYEMLYGAALHAIDMKSTEIAQLRHELAQKNAQANKHNIDALAGD